MSGTINTQAYEHKRVNSVLKKSQNVLRSSQDKTSKKSHRTSTGSEQGVVKMRTEGKEGKVLQKGKA